MHIDQHTIDEIIRKVDIVEIIGKSLKLKKTGGNYLASCPFHKEKTPSFSVKSKDQFFKCFGCGESGNVITFVMLYFGFDFIEAVTYLANKYNINITENTSRLSKEELLQKKQLKLTAQQVLDKVTKFYSSNLYKTSTIIDYINKRGLSREIVNKFEIGYALDNYQGLATLFNDYNINQNLIDVGLVTKNDSGKLYDRFRNRLIFPIKNIRGEVVAFGGRVIHNGEPKYLNSPESILFNKSYELYGLYEAQKFIKESNHVIVVEGYMDVVSLVQFGVSNVVATMGTSINEEHIGRLFRLCDNVYYCFDGDDAGRKAAWRALEKSISIINEMKANYFVMLPDNHDPDSFVRSYGVNKFKDYIAQNAIPLSQFLFDKITQNLNLSIEEGKAKLISLIKPYIEKMKSIAMQVILKQKLADKLHMDVKVIESILNNRGKYAFYNSRKLENQNNQYSQNNAKLATIKNLIYQSLHHINWVQNYPIPKQMEDYEIEVQDLIKVLEFIAYNYDVGDDVMLDNIINNLDLKSNILNDIIFLIQYEYGDTVDKSQILNSKKKISIEQANKAIPDESSFIGELNVIFKVSKIVVNTGKRKQRHPSISMGSIKD